MAARECNAMDELASSAAPAARGDRGGNAALSERAWPREAASDRAPSRGAHLGLCVVFGVATLVLLVIGPSRVRPSDIFSGVGGLSFLILALTFASVGAIVARRVPENRIGWTFLVTGLANSVQLLSWQYADVGLRATHRLPGAPGAAGFNTVIGEATAGLLGLSLLLFPDGRLLSRRWRPALASLLVGMALLVLAGTLRPGRYAEPFAQVSNPFGLAGARRAMDAVDLAGWLFVWAGIGLGAAAMIVRLRRARGLERQQLKLVLAVGSVAATAAALVMATWFIWPEGHLQARIAVLGVCFASLPLAAGVAILRYRLYEIDLVVNRTLVYAAVTVISAAVFAATVVLLGTALGRGSGWATAAATLVVAVAFRPLRSRVQDAVDRRFNRARYDALRRMADFLEDLRAGRAAPEEVERLLRRGALGTPDWSSSSSYRRASSTSTPAGRPSPTSQTTGGSGSRSSAVGSHSAWCCTNSRARKIPPCCEGRSRPAASRSRSRGYASSCAASSPRSRPRGPGSSPPRTRSGGGSSATSTMAPSSGSSRSGSRCATHSTNSAPPRPRARSHTLDGALAEVAVAIEELRELAHGLPPAQLDAGLAPGISRARTPHAGAGRGEDAARAVRPRARGCRLLHRLRGSHQRGQARERDQDRSQRGTRETAARRLGCRRRPWRRCTHLRLRPERPRRPRRRLRRHAAHRERPGRGHDADCGAAVRVVIAEDQVLLREGLGRLFEDAGHEVVASLGDADGLPLTVADHHPDLVVLDIRMPPTFTDEGARAAREIKHAHPELGVLVLSQHIETTHAVELVTLGGFGYLLKDRVLEVERVPRRRRTRRRRRLCARPQGGRNSPVS